MAKEAFDSVVDFNFEIVGSDGKTQPLIRSVRRDHLCQRVVAACSAVVATSK